MEEKEITKKILELHSLMSEYKREFGNLEKDLFRAISEYQKALEEEKLKETRNNINLNL